MDILDSWSSKLGRSEDEDFDRRTPRDSLVLDFLLFFVLWLLRLNILTTVRSSQTLLAMVASSSSLFIEASSLSSSMFSTVMKFAKRFDLNFFSTSVKVSSYQKHFSFFRFTLSTTCTEGLWRRIIVDVAISSRQVCLLFTFLVQAFGVCLLSAVVRIILKAFRRDFSIAYCLLYSQYG